LRSRARDQCTYCTCKGNWKVCNCTVCPIKETWFVKEYDLRHQKLVDALTGLLGCFDTPIARRAFSNSFTEEALKDARETLKELRIPVKQAQREFGVYVRATSPQLAEKPVGTITCRDTMTAAAILRGMAESGREFFGHPANELEIGEPWVEKRSTRGHH